MAFDFPNSSNSKVSTGDSASNSITGDITIECWVKIDTRTGGQMPFVTKYKPSAGQRSYLMSSGGGDPNIFVRGVCCQVASCATVAVDKTSATSLGTTNVNHIAVVMDPTNTTETIYLNGVDDGGTTSGSGGGTADSTADFGVGDDDTNQFNLMDGQISEVRLWAEERSAASLNQYRFKRLDANVITNLNTYWKMDVSGSQTDWSGNSNTGTVGGSAAFVAGVFPISYPGGARMSAGAEVVVSRQELILLMGVG